MRIPKMLAVIQRICIFAFVISPVLHIGNASTSPSTRIINSGPAAFEAQINPTSAPLPAAKDPTTTTTLASSNAPATTIETTLKTATPQQNGTPHAGEETDNNTDAIMTTMLPEFLQQTTKLSDAISATKTTTNTSALDQAEKTTSNVGNEVKIEIKNAQKDMNPQGVQLLPATEHFYNLHEHANDLKSTTKPKPNKVKEAKKSKMPHGLPEGGMKLRATASAMPVAKPDAADTMHNHIEVEGKLKNGLYRIKLAEIITDEFGELPEQKDAKAKPSDKNPHGDDGDDKKSKEFSAPGKVNIADLYPMKKEDLNPIIRDSNVDSDNERTVFKKPVDGAEYRQNLLPNDVEIQAEKTQTQHGRVVSDMSKAAQQHQLRTIEMTLITRDGSDGDTISDFTGKLLADKDGIITEIEEKFRLNEFGATEMNKIANTSEQTPSTVAYKIDGLTTTTNMPIVATKPGSIINQQFFNGNNHKGHDFIDRRVKKSYSFPMHRAASDIISEPYVDFANTKFTGSGSGNGIANGSPAAKAITFTADSATNSDNAPSDPVVLSGVTHPEFSTTKFYNSKELYNEMIMHNRLKQLQNKSGTTTTTTTRTTNTASVSRQPHSNGFTANTTVRPGAASRFATLKNVKSSPVVSKDPLSLTLPTASSTPLTPLQSSSSLSSSLSSSWFSKRTAKRTNIISTTDAPQADAISLNTKSTIQPSSAPLALEIASVETDRRNKFQKELKRAKLLLKVVLPTTTTPLTTASSSTMKMTPIRTSTMSPLIAQSTSNLSTAQHTTTLSSSSITSASASDSSSASASASASTSTTTTASDDALSTISMTTNAAADTNTLSQLYLATNPTKSASKPIARPRILTTLQEKMNSLECEVQNVPQDSHLWRGNETHELILPIITPAHCAPSEQQTQTETQKGQEHQHDCSTSSVSVSWDGESEIQSGDILIVEINDASLLKDKSNTYSAHFTQVYQVTRSGHEHCDVTEGILLDITPLVVDGRKLVTLYDKDLTEGVNLLIVVSELWGSQCVRLKVTAKTDNCGENADCSGKGICYSNASMEEYECQCCSGFAGPHCEEIDACTPSPCTNNGICVDLSQGHDGNSYQCLCPYGYTGKNCQYESDPCNPAECMNGGSCVGNSTHFRCDCSPGYAGPLCQHSLNECESSPCVHGICVDQEDGFRCFCQPGFAGELCNFEYNECESNPCQNGGECIDHIGSFECRCTKGYTGNRCQIKVDFCANKPCPEGHRCIDHGNDFSCECPGGRNGPDCNQMARTQCNVNPCTHGGTCWSSGDSFYCACRPGYTGTMCEDEFVIETVVSSSEFIVDDVNAQNLNDKTFGSSVVLKSPIELHNAYFGAGVLAAAFFIVAVVVTICHCKVNQTYRKFSTRTTSFIPIIGFGRRPKPQSKLNKHWLSGKGLGSGNSLRSSASATSATSSRGGHLSSSNGAALNHSQQQQHTNVGQLHERPFQRHLAMNLENDMYYTVDFSDNSQHSPLIQ